jgi:dynein heavy chain
MSEKKLTKKDSISLIRHHARRDTNFRQRGRLQAISTEAYREQQLKNREEKEQKRARLDGRHEYLLSTVAEKQSLKTEDAEDAILEGNQLDVFDSFFAQGGRTAIIFFYEEKKYDNGNIEKRLWVTDGTKDPYSGCCMFFIRPNSSKAITMLNIHQEVFFGMLESNEEGLLGAIERLLGQVFIPALQQNEKWGDLSGVEAQRVKQQFISKLSSFVGVLANAQASIADAVKLSPIDDEILAGVSTPADVLSSVGNVEIVHAAEVTALRWCHEIEQILTESEQMRKEADDVGPKAELDHWKTRLARFDSLTTSIKSHDCRIVISILLAAKSKVLKTWKELDLQITDFTNEAKDNVKFLYTLEKYCEPLYKCNPVSMLDSIPGLMNAIRMINSYSRYYNTSERMTALFVKVTNQMINACRAHITDNGYHKVWEQEREEVVAKMDQCIRLNKEYQLCFHRTKKRLENNPDEKPFDFSEMYIFGKFNNFSKRLEKLRELFMTVATYACLGLSHIEGIEQLNARFNLSYTNLKKKPYNVLDQRKTEFDGDYEDFKRQLNDINTQLLQLMDEHFAGSLTTLSAIETAKRFMRLNIPIVHVPSHYPVILQLFHREMQHIQSEYNTHKHNPPIARNLPPVASRISWSRQLYQKLSEPITGFRQLPGFLESPDCRKMIRGFNRLAQVLVEYEVLHIQLWKKKMASAERLLMSSVLVRDATSNALLVNFDVLISEFLREVQVLSGMGIELTQNALVLYSRKKIILDNYDTIKLLVSEYDRIIKKIPELFVFLFQPHIEQVDITLSPGLIVHRWTSLNLSEYVCDVQKSLKALEHLIDSAVGIHENRIMRTFSEMQKVPLLDVPSREAIEVDDFIKRTKDLCSTAAASLDTKNQVVEKAVKELIELLLPSNEDLPSSAPEDLSLPGAIAMKRKIERNNKLKQESINLHDYYQQIYIDNLLHLFRGTLECLRKRLVLASSLSYMDVSAEEKKEHCPLFVADIILSLPTLVMKPSLEVIQQSISQAVQTILAVLKSVYCWGQDRDEQLLAHSSSGLIGTISSTQFFTKSQVKWEKDHSSHRLKNYYHSVAENKEIFKLVTLLNTCLGSTKTLVQSVINSFDKYQILWAVDRDQQVTDFSNSNPIISDYQQEMHMFQQLEETVQLEQDTLTAGAISLNTEQLKVMLVTEAKQWRVYHGRAMSHYYQSIMDEIFISIEDWSKIISKPLNDLDDVRTVMATLKDIRENEIRIDECLGPIEECYTLLQRYGITVSQQEVERVDTLRYLWQKLHQQVSQVMTDLIDLQPKFKKNLEDNVQIFQSNVSTFAQDYQMVMQLDLNQFLLKLNL